MAMVEGRDFRFAEPLREGDHRGIDNADREVAVLRLQYTGPLQVYSGRRLDAPRSSTHVVKERQPCVVETELTAPVVEFPEDENRNDQILPGRAQELRAPGMVGIVTVDCCQQWARVADERHLSRGLRHRLSGERGGTA